jgi:hypothetical protein
MILMLALERAAVLEAVLATGSVAALAKVAD